MDRGRVEGSPSLWENAAVQSYLSYEGVGVVPTGLIVKPF
jgi:hypothetical protein